MRRLASETRTSVNLPERLDTSLIASTVQFSAEAESQPAALNRSTDSRWKSVHIAKLMSVAPGAMAVAVVLVSDERLVPLLGKNDLKPGARPRLTGRLAPSLTSEQL